MGACTSQKKDIAEGIFEATEITVSAETSGKIIEFSVEEGDCLSEQQKVALIDTLQLNLQREQLRCSQLATLSSRPDIEEQVSHLKQQITNAKVERNRLVRLLADGAATEKQLDNANQSIATLEKQLASLRSQLSTQTEALNGQAKTIEAQIAQIDDKIRRSIVLSPIAGTVLTKYAEAGEIITPGKPLYKIADLGKIYLRAYLTSTQLANVSIGQKVVVTAIYGDDQSKDYEGVIQTIASQSEFTPKTIQTNDSRANLVYAVKIAVNNDGRLKIGLSGIVHL